MFRRAIRDCGDLLVGGSELAIQLRLTDAVAQVVFARDRPLTSWGLGKRRRTARHRPYGRRTRQLRCRQIDGRWRLDVVGDDAFDRVDVPFDSHLIWAPQALGG